jgi:tetratricopeptide (TPR) repeat protein
LDDYPNILENSHIRLANPTFQNLIQAGFKSPSSSRPVANISFALNFYFHRYHVMGYHLTNILIHIITGVLLYFFIKTTLNIPLLRSQYGYDGWTPYFAAFIWLVHPIQIQSVTYIVQRMNSMAAMFYVLSLLLYVEARLTDKIRKKWALFTGCLFAGILALGSKEISVTLPLFILLYEWYFFQDLKLNWLKHNYGYFFSILIFIGFIVFIFAGTNPSDFILNTYLHRDFTLSQRVLTELRVVIFYISLLLFPHPSRSNIEHNFPLSYSLIDPITTFISLGALIILIAFALCNAKKERLSSFCVLWFFGNLALESSVIGLEIVFEHRTYLPSMFLILMFILLTGRYIKKEWLLVAVLFTVVIICSLWTYQRNAFWRDSITFWTDCVKKSPEKSRVHLNLGLALAGKGKTSKAIHHYSEALRLEPDNIKALNNWGLALAEQGKIEEAIRYFTKAIRLNSSNFRTHLNLGEALEKKGEFTEAIRHYKIALQINPDFAEAHYNWGNILLNQSRFDGAIEHYRIVLRLNPYFDKAYNNLGLSLIYKGDIKGAITWFHKAIQINPGNKQAQYNLLKASKSQNRKDL